VISYASKGGMNCGDICGIDEIYGLEAEMMNVKSQERGNNSQRAFKLDEF
jgi:hypothetical protein